MEKVIWALLFSAIALEIAAQPGKPNIILIVADDLGYGDIAFEEADRNYTPSLARLASEGMRFTDFHSNGPVCSPTRTALMTGRYQQRSGVESALGPDERGLPPSEITIAEYLKKSGYATAVYGKWHLGVIPEANPVRNGFDEFRGHLNSVDYNSHIGPWGNPDWWVDGKLQNEEGYNSDLITAHTIRFIKEHRDEPFFIYVPFSNIHFPWCTPEDPQFWFEGINYYKSIETKLGPHSPHEDVSPVVRRMVNELDESIGKIVSEIKKNGLAENTLIIFTSDNGGYVNYQGRHANQISDNGPLRGQKSDVYEGGTRVQTIAWWPGKIQAGSVTDEIGLSMDLLPTFLSFAGQDPGSIAPRHKSDGLSLRKVLLENASLSRRMVFWRLNSKCAVRDGSWKLVFNKVKGDPELYNLAEDIGEQNNLAAKNPLTVDRMMKAFKTWEKDVERSHELIKQTE